MPAHARSQLLSLIRPVLQHIMHSPVGKRITMQLAEWERDGVLLPIPMDDTQHLSLSSSSSGDHTGLNASFSSSTDSGYTPLTLAGSVSTGYTSPQSIGTMIERPLERERSDRGVERSERGDWRHTGGTDTAGDRGDRGGIRTLTSTPTGIGRAKGPVPSQVAPGALERRAMSGGTIVSGGSGAGTRGASPRGSPVPKG